MRLGIERVVCFVVASSMRRDEVEEIRGELKIARFALLKEMVGQFREKSSPL